MLFMTTPTGHHEPLGPTLRRWVDDGLISAEQADRIAAAESRREATAGTGPVAATTTPARTPRRGPTLAVEALGYLGGILILVAIALVVGQFWQDTPVALRVVLLGGAAALLVVAGAGLPQRLGEAGARLRTVLWTLSVVATGGTLAVVGYDVLDLREEDAVQLLFAGAAVLAAVLWWLARTSLLQAALLVPLVGSLAALLSRFSDDGALIGAGVWVLGAAWFALGRTRLLTPHRTAELLGAATTLIASLILMSEAWGRPLALLTVAAVIALALLADDLALLALGALGALWVVPRVVGEWFPGRLAAPLVLLAVGVLMVLAAVRVARRRGRVEHPAPS